MTQPLKTLALLTELEALDVREGRVVDVLLRHGAHLERVTEEAERRSRVVTVADLLELKDGLARLETAINDVQGAIDRAEAGAPPTTPSPIASFDALAATIREHNAESDRLRTLLRDSLVAFKGVDDPEDDHAPGPKPSEEGPRTFRLTTPLMSGADVKAFQRVLNHRLATWGIHAPVREDGGYGAQTRHAAHRVALGLGLTTADYAHGITPAIRGLIRTPSRRTPEQVQRAQGRRDWLRKLRKRHASTGPRVPSAHAPARTSAPPSGLQAAIRAHGGRYEDLIVREAGRAKVPVSLVCAVIEIESSFTNVFGHDGVRNPIKSPPRPAPNLEVTEARYKDYLRHRNRGEGCQGVGPMQLTSSGLQDRADKLGGCFRPGPNIRVGIELLAANIKRLGLHDGVRAYNGSGPAAETYATEVLRRERIWRSRLDGHAVARPDGHAVAQHAGHAAATASTPHAARTFRLTTPLMSGDDVKAFQRVLNHRFAAWGIHERIHEDGDYGKQTRHAAHRVALGLGLMSADYAQGITPAVRGLIRTPSRRTPEQLQRAQGRRDWLRRLRRRYASAAPATARSNGPATALGAGAGTARYPLATRGKLIGTPHAGTHTLGNWQSDNAVDLGVPEGTRMIALDDGLVVKVRHHPPRIGRFAGDQITIRGDHGNSYFYAHGASSVRVGQRVRRGQTIGTSGSANGVAHLHFGIEHGDPREVIGQQH